MTSSAHDVVGPQLSARAYDVGVSDGALEIKLEDGRILHVLLAYFPRLLHATGPQRDNWQLIGRGVGIHWPDLDEDVSVENLLGHTASCWCTKLWAEESDGRPRCACRTGPWIRGKIGSGQVTVSARPHRSPMTR